jgi:hypothetical protein
MFHVGQRVVCVRNDFTTEYDETIPRKGGLYTIRAIRRGRCGYAFVQLVEIVNPKINYVNGVDEVAFIVYAFRPVVERPTDISIFQRMLVPSHLPQKV